MSISCNVKEDSRKDSVKWQYINKDLKKVANRYLKVEHSSLEEHLEQTSHGRNYSYVRGATGRPLC